MNRIYCVALTVFASAAGAVCLAQDNSLNLRRDRQSPLAPLVESSSGVVTPTPEMWFYAQERTRLEDPKLAVRRRAEARGEERRSRLASMAWYGVSNERPTVSPTPWFGGYSPHWSSNTVDPMRWKAVPAPLVVTRPTERVR